MTGSTIWKLILSALIVFTAVLYLQPYKDTPFKDYILAESNQDSAFTSLVEEAQVAYENEAESYKTFYVALRGIANNRSLDLSQYFPHLILEASLRNTEIRNEVLMEELLKRSKARLQPGLDLKGGVVFVFELDLDPTATQYQKEGDLSKAIDILGKRINALGVTEPIIRTTGENRIEVQLPGESTVSNPEVESAISKPARLEFHLVHRTAVPTSLNDPNAPIGYVAKALENEAADGSIQTSYLYIKRIPEMKGDAIDEARAAIAEFGGFEILMDFTSEGGRQFEQLTRDISSRNTQNAPPGLLAITLDGELLTAPSVRFAIAGDSARITGSFTQREAEEIANGLNNPLDVELRIAELYEVGPTMAEDAVNSGKQAFIIGAAVVVFFMLFYYMIAGVVALISVVLNLVIVAGTLSSLGATLTLPGIAALVLTVGMAVDANILIYERMREELQAGKTLKNSLLGGFNKAFSTIVDANVTTLITSFILIYFGTGPVKGFGVTLAIGIGSTMFSALIVSRAFLDLLINTEITKRMLTVTIFKETSIQFLDYRKYAFITSWIIVLIGVSMAVIKGDDIYGIDFTGGDEIAYHFKQELTVAEVDAVASGLGIEEVSVTSQTPLGANTDTVLKVATEFEKGVELNRALLDSYPDKGLELIGINKIGPTVGKEIQLNAFMSIGIALICILLYVALRFEVGFGVGAVVATVHDLFMTIGIFVLFDNQFSAPMVAALLMIVGYSLNDTIVVFDRIREELDLNPGLKLNQIVNLAINRTLTRTILTSVTTLLVTVSLLIFGTGIIRDFAFTFVVGILTGTFSSIFIASPVFYWWHKGDRRHVESHSDVLPKYEWEAGAKSKSKA